MAFICPRCGTKSYHPMDEQEGYCANCSAFLSGPVQDKTSGGWTLMPPGGDVCQTCATDHAVEEPHNPASLYWQTARAMADQPQPTWVEALEHCTDEVYAGWREVLTSVGVDLPERPS